MRWLGGITNAIDVNLSKLWETVEARETWHAMRKAPHTVYAVAKSWKWFNDWATTTNCRVIFLSAPCSCSWNPCGSIPRSFLLIYIPPTYLKESNHDVPAFSSFLQPWQLSVLSPVLAQMFVYFSESWLFLHLALSPQLTSRLWVHGGFQLFSNKWTWGEARIQFTALQK